MSKKHRKFKKGGEDFPLIPVIIIFGFLLPGLSGLIIPAVVLYFLLKNLMDIDLIEEFKKITGIEFGRKKAPTDEADYTQEYAEVRNYVPQQRSGVRKTDDPCGNEGYHSTFGQQGAPQKRSGVRKTDDPCGNEGYHSTFGEQGHMPPRGKVASQQDPCGNEGYHGTFSDRSNHAEKKQSRLGRFAQKIKDGRKMSSIGLGCGLLFGACSAIEGIEAITTFGLRGLLTEDFLTLLLFSALGFGAFTIGKFKTAKANRFRKLRSVIGEDTTHISIHALADAVGYSDSKTEDLVQDMIDEGLLGDTAYIDVTTGYLILDGKGVDKEGLSKKQPKEKKADDQLDLAVLQEIRRVNADIPDPVMTRKISRIEEITGHILDYQKKHPEKTPELRKFLDYYLPTTLKILNTYAELDQKGLNGDNAVATKARIEKMMDNVVEGFEAQLDKLFEGEMMDISSDITVMEKMLDSDGLTGGFKIPKMDTESVADDAFQHINLTMEKMEPTRPIAEPKQTAEPAGFPTGGYSGINLTLEPEEKEESSSDRMFESIHQSFGGSAAAQASASADDMFQSIHMSLGEEKEEDWQSGFYHRKKEELDEE